MEGTSLVVQWLRLRASTTGGAGLILAQGTKIPLAVQPNENNMPIEMGNWSVEKWNNLPRSKKQSGNYLGPWCFTPETSLKKKKKTKYIVMVSSRSVVSDSLQPRGPQCARVPCPSPSPGVCSDLCPLRCHLTISSSVAPFSCPPFFPASRSFPLSWLFPSGCQNIAASAPALPMNIQGEDIFFLLIIWE